MSEKVSASGLLDSLSQRLGFKRKPVAEEAQAVEAVVSATAPTSTETMVSAPEPIPTMVPQPTSTEAPTPTAAPPAPEESIDWSNVPSPAANEIPDWLRASSPAESVKAPLPEAPLPAPAVPVVEAPVQAALEAEAEVESDPFARNREFNGYMETIRQAQAVLASGFALNSEERKKALIAVARSNSLLPKLPPEVLESVLLMRAVASGNPKFGRDDFQREMLAAMDVIKTGVAAKG